MAAWVTPASRLAPSGFLESGIASTFFRPCRPTLYSRTQARMHMDIGNAREENDILSERKGAVRKLLEDGAPRLLENGWGCLARWRNPIFAKDVEFTFPFMPEMRGRIEIQLLLQFMDLITIWEGVDARVDEVMRVTSPQPDMLVFGYVLIIPIENSRKVVNQHVRIVLRFNDDGLIRRWDETWSHTTEEVLEQIWNLGKYDDPDFGEFVIERPRDELRENIQQVPKEEGAARAFRKNVDELVHFLARQLPRYVMRGSDLKPMERAKMYKFFSDDAELEYPNFEFRGRKAVECALSVSLTLSKLMFKSFYMELVSIRRLGPRVINARYATRAVNRLGRQVVWYTNSRVYVDMAGKIARKTDEYTMDGTIDIAGNGWDRGRW